MKNGTNPRLSYFLVSYEKFALQHLNMVKIGRPHKCFQKLLMRDSEMVFFLLCAITSFSMMGVQPPCPTNLCWPIQLKQLPQAALTDEVPITLQPLTSSHTLDRKMKRRAKWKLWGEKRGELVLERKDHVKGTLPQLPVGFRLVLQPIIYFHGQVSL